MLCVNPINVILKQKRFVNSRCFKVEITASKFEENVMILQRVYWAIAMCTFCIVGLIYPHGTQMRGNLSKNISNERKVSLWPIKA